MRIVGPEARKKRRQGENNIVIIDVYAYLHEHDHCCPASFPLQPAAQPTYLLHSIYAVLWRKHTHTRDARTATVQCSSVEGQRGRITSLAVPCLEAASHPALRNPHVHFPISCYPFCFLLRGNSTRLVPEAGPIARHQPARHPVLSNAQVPSGPRFTAQASPCT